MSKFETYFEKPYKLLEKTLAATVFDRAQVIDLGSGSGTVAQMIDRHHLYCKVGCIDRRYYNLVLKVPEAEE